MRPTDKVLSAFPGAVGGGEDLPPSTSGDVLGSLLKGKQMEKSPGRELKQTALFSVFHSPDTWKYSENYYIQHTSQKINQKES